MSDPLVIGLVAGESSGDTLGAALLQALRARVGAVRAFGIAGPKMRAAGCEVWADSHELAVMGLSVRSPLSSFNATPDTSRARASRISHTIRNAASS